MLAAGSDRERAERRGGGRVGGAVVVAEAVGDAQDPAGAGRSFAAPNAGLNALGTTRRARLRC